MAHPPVPHDGAVLEKDSFGQDIPGRWESNETRQAKAQHMDAVKGMSNEEVWTLVRRWDKVYRRISELYTFLDTK